MEIDDDRKAIGERNKNGNKEKRREHQKMNEIAFEGIKRMQRHERWILNMIEYKYSNHIDYDYEIYEEKV